MNAPSVSVEPPTVRCRARYRPVRPYRAVVQRRLAFGLVAAMAIVAVLIGALALVRNKTNSTPACTVSVDGKHYGLDRSQVANSETVARSAAELALPHHAVTVALTAAFQESGLRNLSHGDRDSLGLFQQRPSQGWGTPAQILDTRYASVAFLRALSRVSGWEALPVAEAAQRVQRSAAPTAYAAWESEGRAVARVVTGEVVNGLACRTA